ncbi:CotO family spore coat protein [Neobacillus drentensis]|uniref:CotO family spore coat protein n=1 Tax=Neobacillus drentensis TaxID=220684 RepID=UPI0008240132|nr:CotO family spore coat protein [Neobacillus drentensis]
MSKKKSKGPLLYIHQPFARPPATNMQDSYSIKLDEVLIEEETPIEAESKKKISLAKKDIEPEPKTKEENKLENQQKTAISDKHHSTFKRVKPFKEMNVIERLDYLINYPIVLPPPPCVFITDEGNYQGYLTKYDGNEITIRFHDQTKKTVSVNALKNVMLIGIKK